MSSCNKMAIDPASAALIAGALGSFKQSKIAKAEAGEKTYTKPKTIFGKLIGGISGRTAAAEASAGVKTAPLNEKVMNSLQPSAKSTPITGGISFGGEAAKKTYLPFAIVAAVVAAFYFMRKKGGRRRR